MNINWTEKRVNLYRLATHIIISFTLAISQAHAKDKIFNKTHGPITIKYKSPDYKTVLVTQKRMQQQNEIQTDFVKTQKLEVTKENINGISHLFKWNNNDISQISESTINDPSESIQDFYARALSIKPSFRIKENGDFIESTNAQDLIKEIKKAGHNRFRSQGPQMLEMVDGFTEEIYKNALSPEATHKFWTYLVEAWNNLELTQDVELVEKKYKPEPLYNNHKLPRVVTKKSLGSVPCGDVTKTLYCLELELRDSIDVDMLKEALEPYLKSHNEATNEELEILNFQDDYTISLIALPDSLKPYYLHVSHIFFTRYRSNGVLKDLYLFNRDQYIFTYID